MANRPHSIYVSKYTNSVENYDIDWIVQQRTSKTVARLAVFGPFVFVAICQHSCLASPVKSATRLPLTESDGIQFLAVLINLFPGKGHSWQLQNVEALWKTVTPGDHAVHHLTPEPFATTRASWRMLLRRKIQNWSYFLVFMPFYSSAACV